MNQNVALFMYAGAGGFPIFLGGLAAFLASKKTFVLKNEVNHWVVAFGGGALLSAVSLALIPESINKLNLLEISLLVLFGCIAFMLLDYVGNRIGGSVSQVIAMMMDFIPEAISLGASFAVNRNFGLLLAVFIGIQNFPEGYNSYYDLTKQLSRRKTLLLMFVLSFVGIIAAFIGEQFLVNHDRIVAALMMFSSSGIIYLIFQDIAPMSKRVGDYIPATGACIGFLLGMIGQQLL